MRPVPPVVLPRRTVTTRVRLLPPGHLTQASRGFSLTGRTPARAARPVAVHQSVSREDGVQGVPRVVGVHQVGTRALYSPTTPPRVQHSLLPCTTVTRCRSSTLGRVVFSWRKLDHSGQGSLLLREAGPLWAELPTPQREAGPLWAELPSSKGSWTTLGRVTAIP